jgi:putative SOS response-associated peptidase YedK
MPTTSGSTSSGGDARCRKRGRARADDLRSPAEESARRTGVQFKADGRRFGNSNRCLVPASAFFEFTGKRYPKAKHRFALKGAPLMAIAGLWGETEGDGPPAFTILTTAPSADVAPYHDRQVAVLRPEDWAAWLYLTKPEAELLRPLPEDSLEVKTVREGSD